MKLFQYIPRVGHYVAPYWKLAVVSAVMMVVAGAVALLVPWPLKILVDNILGRHPMPPWLHSLIGNHPAKSLWVIVAVVGSGFLVIVLQNALTVLDNYVNVQIEQNMVLDFRSDLFRHAERLSLAYHDQKRSGMLIYAINNQGDAVARSVMTIPPLAHSLITLVGMFWIVFRMNSTLALMSLVVLPFLYYSVSHYMKHVQGEVERVMQLEGQSLSIVHEAISMLRVIVAFGREAYEHKRFLDQGRQAVDARIKVTVRQTMFSLAVNTIIAAGTALVLGYGAYECLLGKLTVGQLLVVMSYVALVYHPLETISSTLGSFQQLSMRLAVSFRLLDQVPDIVDKPGAVDMGRVRGEVVYEDVGFAYSDRTDTLREINFRAEAGQVIGIVGATGAGKSTLVSLLPRFYGAGSGRILIDGTDTRDVTLASLRRQVSIVLQEPLLFSGTIADNIRYGRMEATQDEIVEAARAANAHGFISKLPNGYDTEIGERGAKLSGGERQRISVARAFLKDAPILILDEPTSAIDSKTEAVILDALDRLMVGRTTFMIAHRLSTLRRASKILVLEGGQIVQQGTHDEMVNVPGVYRQLFTSQNRPMAKRRLAAEPVRPEADNDGTVAVGVNGGGSP